jgi:outer membrane protein OmpA-like peptidoglycan-associated protein
MNAALDKSESTVKCAASDQACIGRAKAEGKQVAAVEPGGGAVAGGSAGDSAALKPGEGAWLNYDFVPGTRVLFYDDFTGDTVGDFPKRLEFKKGNLEIAEWHDGRYLRTETHSQFDIPLSESLPKRFTVEFDFYPGAIREYGYPLEIHFSDDSKDDYVFTYGGKGGINGGRGEEKAMGQIDPALAKTLLPVRIMVDDRYVKVYMAGKRVANAPNARLGRSKLISITVPAWKEEATLLGNFRIAAGGRKLYDAIAEKGRVATQGIFFDVGSDRIRPESTPTLKEIAEMLKEHAELRLTIEGHTDNQGDAGVNQSLSEHRAEAVKAALVSTFGVSGDRLTSKGLGATKPAAPNSTVEGRQQNRRVELVKAEGSRV